MINEGKIKKCYYSRMSGLFRMTFYPFHRLINLKIQYQSCSQTPHNAVVLTLPTLCVCEKLNSKTFHCSFILFSCILVTYIYVCPHNLQYIFTNFQEKWNSFWKSGKLEGCFIFPLLKILQNPTSEISKNFI